ncbi:MAG: hypothetical protein KAH56_02975 [Candidatus Krumholzibacteria bacterium]|nr:hypothetical protein [Candidatus Krumholzibacteria bacterium]
MGSRIIPSHYRTTYIPGVVAVFLLPILFLILPLSMAHAEWGGFYSELAFDQTGYEMPLAFCSDGNAGQTFIATFLDLGSYPPITIKKYDRTGNPMWGPNGVVVPLVLGATQMQPLTMEPDYDGGVYVSYRGLSGSQYIVWLAHFNRDGIMTWNTPVGDFMTASEHVSIHLAADNSGAPGCLVGWSQYDDLLFPDRVITAFLDLASGGVQWQVDPGISAYISDFLTSEWTVKPDGQSGFFVGRFDGVQRLSHDGVLMFGAGGTILANLRDHLGGLVADGNGGCFVLTHSRYGGLEGQHVDAAGNITWSVNGLELSPSLPDLCNSAVCSDNAGGFFFVTGYEDLFAQRFNVNGDKLWGSAGITVTSLPGWQLNPDLTPDGFGGFLMAYEDNYYSNSGYKPAISAMRLDANGSITWRADGVFWDYSASVGHFSPRVASDGWGGAAVGWEVSTDGTAGNQIGIGSLDFNGACPPICKLAYCDPPFGESGDLYGNVLYGQYLDSYNDYLLRWGSQEFPLTFQELAPDGGSFGAQVDLSAAPDGVYDVVVRKDMNELASLPGVYGVGTPMTNGSMEGIPDYNANYVSRYGRRTSAVDPQGDRYQAWIKSSLTTLPSKVMLWVYNGTGASVSSVFETTNDISDLSITLHGANDLYYTFISYDGVAQYLGYIHNGFVQFLYQPAPNIFSPVVAVDASGQAMIVFNYWDGGLNTVQMKSVEVDDVGFGTVLDLPTGNGAQDPDLVGTDTGFTLAFVRDFWFPGAREMCYLQYEDDSWAAAAGLGFGWEITSPSVAWDGVDDLLFAYVVNNFDGERTVFTNRLHGGAVGGNRWVKTDPEFQECLVAGGGDDNFFLVTQGGPAASQTSIEVHRCDGQVVFPPVVLTGPDGSEIPSLAANSNGDISVAWRPIAPPGFPYQFVRWDYPVDVSAVEDLPAVATPLGARPNPFNPRTVLEFSLLASEDVSLAIYDIRGRRLRDLHHGPLEVGNHEFVWSGKDDQGRRVSSGVYFARLIGTKTRQVTKITMLK